MEVLGDLDGSSPRLRGTQPRSGVCAGSVRFIPAPAGNAFRTGPGGACSTVHPRACGERPLHGVAAFPSDGSSPRLRGTQPKRPWYGPWRRFIPAPAGNALWRVEGMAIQSVHPRACGERIQAENAEQRNTGSSPRLRGTQFTNFVSAIHKRFIPAPAGNAGITLKQIASFTVHPRTCGERNHATLIDAASSGSSPRLRGTRRTPTRPTACPRFIPAPAGNAR